MTVTVDFLPFATAVGANVEDQSDYASDVSTANGFSSGIASSSKFNKAMRQATFVGAAIANWISQVLGASVSDDGNLSEFVGQFNGALATTVQNNSFNYAVAAGSATAMTAALAPAPAALVAGMELVLKCTTANTGAATLNLNALGAAPITFGGGALSAGMMQSGQLYALAYDGANWQLQAPTQSGIIAASLGANGYKVYANGLIEQWGFASTLTNQALNTITFPTPFPNTCFHTHASLGTSLTLTSNEVGVGASPLSSTQMRVAIATSSAGTTGVYWSAKGN